jgi:hypothetical protein
MEEFPSPVGVAPMGKAFSCLGGTESLRAPHIMGSPFCGFREAEKVLLAHYRKRQVAPAGQSQTGLSMPQEDGRQDATTWQSQAGAPVPLKSRERAYCSPEQGGTPAAILSGESGTKV